MPLQPNSYNVLFITEQNLIDTGIINDNVDMKIVQPVIRMAQEKHIQPLLGTHLYTDLQNKVSGSTLNSDETFLLNAYVTPCFTWYIIYEVSFLNHLKIKNQGLEKQTGDHSQPASLSELQAYQNKIKEDAEFYAQRLIRYIEANLNLFPAYFGTATLGDMPPELRGYQSSMYLGNDRPYYHNWRYRGLFNDCDFWNY